MGVSRRCSEPGGSVAVAIGASRAPGRYWVVRRRETMRNQFLMIVVMILWLGITSILCFVCWQAGGAYGPLFLARPSTDVAATLTPVSLSDDLTNTPLRAY